MTTAGQLIATIDANGNTTTYIHNLTNKIEQIVDRLGRTNSVVYDTRGNVITTTNALSGVNPFAFDDLDNKTNEVLSGLTTNAYGWSTNGLLLQSVQAGIATNSFTYDGNGNVLTGTDAYGSVVTNFYDNRGLLVAASNLFGLMVTNSYDGNARLVSSTDTAGTVTTNQYDLLGNLTFTQVGYYSNSTFVALTSTGYGYDAEGNRVAETNALNVVTRYGYDAQNRIVTVTNAYGTADQTLSQTIYDLAGRVAQEIDARGLTSAFGYDAVGRRASITNALGTPVQQVITFAFDAEGNQTNAMDSFGRTTDYAYDALNRPVVTLLPATVTGGARTGMTNVYDALNRRIAVTNQAGLATRFQFDTLSRLITVTNALNKATSYQYDPNGNLTNQVDALNRSTKFDYNAIDRRTKRTLPAGQVETFGYDTASRLLAQTNFNGTVITNQYDALGRLWKRANGSTLLETYAYSTTGQLTNRVDASGTFTWVYDSLGRLKTNSTPVGTLYYQYDANGNLTNLTSSTANGVSISYQYDALNRLTNAIDNRLSGTKNTAYTFDGVGNLRSLKYPNGLTNLWQYDSLNRLTNLTWKLNGAQRGDFTYQLGAAGNRTNLVDNVSGTNRTFTWMYDSIFRMTNETVSGGTPTGTLGYVYDDVGNRTSRTGTVGSLSATNNTFDVNDWLDNDSITNNANPYFDASGNTRTNGTIYYGYDWANRLSAYTNGSTVVTIVYDADGNRVKKTTSTTTNLYLVATVNPTGYAQVVEELSVSGSTTNLVRVYTHGLDLISQRQISGTLVTFYSYDGLGSVRFLTESTGAITNTYAYSAYGSLIASNTPVSNVYLYAGEQYDPDLGLYFLRARYFDPNSGRFWTMDSFEGRLQDPLSLHKYLYAHNNPVNKTDPSGHWDLISIQTVTAISVTINLYSAGVNLRKGNYAMATVDLLSAGLGAFGLFGGPPSAILPQLASLGGRTLTAAQQARLWQSILAGASSVSEAIAVGDLVMMSSSTGSTISQSSGGGSSSSGGNDELDWSIKSSDGETRVDHVTLHSVNDLQKKLHGVFYGNPVEVIKEAWRIKRASNLKPINAGGNVDIYVIPRANAGYQGGYAGQGQNLDNVVIITQKGTRNLITGYPAGAGN